METSFKASKIIITISLLASPINQIDADNFQKKSTAIKEDTQQNTKINTLLEKKIQYLCSNKETKKGLKKYIEYRNNIKNHNYNLLRKIALSIVEDAISNKSDEDTFLGLLALEISNEDGFCHYFKEFTKSKLFPIQAKTLSILKNIETEEAISLIQSYLSSDFIILRLEALSILVQKQTKSSIGEVEALMNLVSKNYHPMFVDFYAMCGDKYAISTIKKMLCQPHINLHVAVVNAIKKYKIEELIPNVRDLLTHTNPNIQEISCSAIGSLQDFHSIQNLEILANSKHPLTALAAHEALYKMGKKTSSESIKKLAKNKNLFAISILDSIENSIDLLKELYHNNNKDVQMNAAISLLKEKNSYCLPLIKKLLNLDINNHYIATINSPGNAFTSYTIVPSYKLNNPQQSISAKGQSLEFQRNILQECINLTTDEFISIIDEIFTQKNNMLIPLAVTLLENLNNIESKKCLVRGSEMLGAPFTRIYSHLSLWKLTKNKYHRNYIEKWIKNTGKHKIIDISQNKNTQKFDSSRYELSLDEKSHLLIDSLLNISKNHDSDGLDCIIELIINGHEKNIPLLAGVLLKTIQ